MTTRKEKVNRRKSDPGTLTFRPVQEKTTVAAELPWGASKIVPISVIDYNLPTGVFVGQSLLLELFSTFEKKIQAVTEDEPMEKLFNKSLARGGDVILDNLCRSLNTISELCLPSVLDALLKWHKRMEANITEKIQALGENKPKQILVKKLLAINYLLCIVLIEILNQLEFHLTTCEPYVKQILDLAFKHMQYKDPSILGQNHNNSLVVAETYAEVIGVISDTRFPLIHRHFVNTLTELKKDTSPLANQQIIALLMAMKFLKIKSNQVDDLEIGIKFLDDLAGFFLEVKDKDVKHAAAGLLVEILLPIASLITRETNVPALINFVGRLYNPTSELASKKHHKLAAYPLLTCLLCVSQRTFFLANWGTFLTNALASLKNRDSRISRVALESLYRLLWVYMIRNHSDRDTRTRLESICGSLFPKGNRNIVPRDAPLNIFVKIIHFIAQQKLDFAFKDVIFDLLCCNRSNRTIYPERMNIGLRALMVIADGLQQKDDPPAMPKSMGPSASGTMQRIKKKTYITRPLTVEIARALGLDQYYVPCRKAFDSILRTLDVQVGKPMMLTVVQKGKDVEELLGGDVKPKLDLFRTCVAAIPRLLPEPMSHTELIEIITRLTIHMDEELRNLAGLTLQTMLNEFPDWRECVITSLIQLIHNNITDFYPAVLDDSLRLLLTLIGAWKQNAISEKKKEKTVEGPTPIPLYVLNYAATLHAVEGLALVMFCQKRLQPRKIAMSLIKEVKNLIGILNLDNCDALVINVLDEASPYVIKKYIDHVPLAERLTWPSDFSSVADRIGMIELDNSLVNIDRGNEYLQWDPWACALSGYSEKQFLLSRCPTAVASAWPMLFSRLIAVNGHVDPNNPQNESRASLLRGSKSKTSSIYGEALSQEECLSLWSKYMVLTCAFAPPSVNTASLASRSFSPTSSVEADVLRSVSSSLRGFRAVNNTMSLSQLLLKVSSMLRWENMTDIRDSVVLGIGSLNPLAFDSLLDELNQRQILREAQEKKVETNIRRKKRKDLLRLQLIRLFEVAVWRGVLQSNLIDSSGHLNPLLLEFIDTMRLNLEVDQDRDVVILTSLRLHFAKLVALIVESVPPSSRGHLIPDDNKKSLFYLFIGWCSRTIAGDRRLRENDVGSYLEQKAVLAMTRLLCCGPIFEANKSIGEDGYLYGWLDKLVASSNHTMQVEVEEMLALMLDLNESSYLVDWLINQCYSQNADVSARCFRALVRAFSRRDFPCEFVSLFVLCQAMSADSDIVDVAVHMMELLKKQFLDANSTICSPIATGSPQVALRGAPTPSFSPSNGHCYPVEQETISRNLAKLYPHLTITVFSEVSCRLESALLQNRGHLLSLLLPWIENMELVDATAGEEAFEGPRGWGSEEATQLLLNNLMYLTTAFSTEHEHHIAALWKALAVSFPANLPAILNYLYALIVLSHDTLLPYAKRICVFLSGAVGNRLNALLLDQLTTSADQSKLTLERVEIAPYYRWKDETEKRDFTNDCLINSLNMSQRLDETQQEGVRLLPMPAYGGHYSSLSQFLPSATQSIQFFTRSQVALLLVCDLIRSSGDVDWTAATPRLLHSGVLNLDSLRPVLCRHARKIIINVCMLYADASTYSQVSAILLKNQMSLTTTEPFLKDVASLRSASGREMRGESPTFSRVAEEEYRQMLLHSNALFSSHSDLIKAVVFCLSENMDQPLWPNEDATSRNWKVTSANQLSCLVRHLAAELFLGPLPLLPVVWTQTAMRMALATPQRHLAGRCFQIVSSLCQSPCAWIPSLISRLVETAGEQHEETQAYVTDLLVCLLNSASTLSGVLPESPPLSCASPTHTRSTSYTPALLRQSMMNQRIQNDRKDARLSLLVAEEQPWTATAALVRSKSAEQLKTDTEGDEEATARVQMCAIAVSLLESNLENEFNLALNLLEKILATAGVHKIPCIQKLEKTIQQLEWKSFTNIVSLVVRGAIVPMAIEPSLQVQIQLLELLNEPVIGGKDSFSLIICHMLPYLLLNFESPTQLCTEISSSVARYCKSEMEKAEIRTVDHPFNHLATVMIQYSTKTFTKDRWQWTKCVIQYVCEGLEKSAVTPMLVYLAEILDRGPPTMASYILHMIYLLVNQRDPAEPPLPVNAQVARVVSRHVQGSNWREASRVYKAIVEQWQNAERDKKSDPSTTEQPSFELDIDQIYGDGKSPASPRKNVADSSLKRQPPPHVRVRDRLVALLSASGLRVGLPSAQSVVFSQSELGSASSSTERICPSSQELASTNSLPDPSVTDSFPRVFKEFDFLEAEHDSVSETAESCFGWLSTMRPTSLGEMRQDIDVDVDDDEDSESAQANSESGGAESRLSRTSQCSSEERTPCPSETDGFEEDINEEEEEDGFDGLSMPLEESAQRQSAISPQTASSIGFIKRSTQDLGMEEASIDGSSIIGTRSVEYYPNQPASLPLIVQCSHHCDSKVDIQWTNLISEVSDDNEGDVTAFAILLATQMFRTSCSRVLTLLRDASVIFGVRPLSRALISAQDTLARMADCPFIFVTAQFLRGSGLMQRLKYSLYEMREHVETFNERKEQCIRMLNSVRSAYKLTALCGSTTSLNGQNETDLAKLLSKTFFQLMQMNDTLHHMLQLLEEAPSSQLYSLSPAVLDHHRELLQNMPDSHSTELMAARSDFNGDSLVLLMANKRYSQALQTVRQLRLSLDGEFGCCDQTDIDVLLLLFCRSHTLKAWALVGAAADAMRRQSDLLRDANADLATATANRRFPVDSTPQRTVSAVSSLNESFSKLSYHPDM